jgi:hypothetical protein
MIGNGLFGKAISKFKGIVSEELQNSLVFEEIVFGISKRITIPATGTPLDIVFDPTACSCAFVVFLPFSAKAFGAGPIHLDIYTNPTYTGGTPIPVVNRDFTSSNTSDISWLLSPAVTDPGTKLPAEFIILSDGIPATATIGGESKEDLVFNIDFTKEYLLRFENQEASPTTGGLLAATWFEIPPPS